MTKQLKCFIACAFGIKEIDTIYSKSILPILRELKIKPMRVDKINHNKNIDQKIIELIKSCDFCLADLTYSRPSVYYEAGFIHGLGKEVIFTVRKDHFKPKVNDTADNQRIHFDLITKNIIDWTSPSSKFKQRLKARIKLISAPVIEKKNFNSKLLTASNKFSKQSLRSKIQILDKLSVDTIINNKYKVDKETKRIVGIKDAGKKKDIICFYLYDSLTLSELRRHNEIAILVSKYGSTPKRNINKLTSVFTCFNKTNLTSVQKAFPEHKVKEFNNFIIANNSLQKHKVIIVNKIASDIDYLERVNQALHYNSH